MARLTWKGVGAWLRSSFDARDLHAYGGLALVLLGAQSLLEGSGLLLAGAGLFYLAIRRA